MAFAIDTYTGNGSTTTFSVTFPYIEKAHVIVTVDGVTKTLTSDYTFTTSSTITFTSAPAASSTIKFTRSSNRTGRLVDYQDGSTLTEATLDQDGNQSFFMAQEAIDVTENTLNISQSTDQWDAINKRITNVANPVNDQDVATKHYLENTWLSASDKTTITNVNNNISAINTVNSNISAITTTNSNATNINTVATNIASVNTVATNINDVIAVANDLAEAVSEVETVANDLNEATSEIDTVANSITNVDTVGTNIANINTLAPISANITTVAGIASNVTSVANNETNINAVNSNSTNINTVAGANTNINSVAGSIANVNTVATNLTDINSFENTYKISASAPTGVPEGTLWFDTTADVMKVYDGSSFINAGSSVNGTSGRFKYIATANQTTFTGASHSDTGGAVLTYDAGFINVFKNGVHLDPSDYTATDGNNVVLDVGCAVNDEIYILTFGTFSLASFSATAVTSDTLAVARGGTGKTTSDLSGQQGKALVVNSAQNGFDLSTTSSAEVYGFETYYNGSTLVKTVTVQSVGGSNKYFIDGVQQDTLELYEGNTYVFNHPSAHPFRFSTDSGNSNAYTTGVTVNSSTQVTIVVATDAPTLYYYCSSHSGMGGQANTPVPAVNSVRVITTNQGADNISQSQYANFD
jgi:hypothetical protein